MSPPIRSCLRGTRARKSCHSSWLNRIPRRPGLGERFTNRRRGAQHNSVVPPEVSGQVPVNWMTICSNLTCGAKIPRLKSHTELQRLLFPRSFLLSETIIISDLQAAFGSDAGRLSRSDCGAGLSPGPARRGTFEGVGRPGSARGKPNPNRIVVGAPDPHKIRRVIVNEAHVGATA